MKRNVILTRHDSTDMILQSPLFVTVYISMTVYNCGLSVFLYDMVCETVIRDCTRHGSCIVKENARFVLISIFD